MSDSFFFYKKFTKLTFGLIKEMKCDNDKQNTQYLDIIIVYLLICFFKLISYMIKLKFK